MNALVIITAYDDNELESSFDLSNALLNYHGQGSVSFET